MIKRDPNNTELKAGEKYVVEDKKSGSGGIVPIQVDDEYSVKVIKIDNGILQNKSIQEIACDFMLIITNSSKDQIKKQVRCQSTIKQKVDTITTDKSNKIVCMAELKGSNNNKEVAHAYKQIAQSISRVPSQYLEDSYYVMATIAGAQDKTLPSLINQDKRSLCKSLFAKSWHKVKNMDNLVFYVQPNKKINKAFVNINKCPRVIECHSKTNASIHVPSMFIEAVEK